MLDGLDSCNLTLYVTRADNYALPDDAWHVTDYYANIRKKLQENCSDSPCFNYKDSLPTRMCSVPINARTEFTPRANPDKTSITSIVKPNEKGYVPFVKEPLEYTGPDVFNPYTAVPEGEVDVLAIVSLGRTYPDDGHRRTQELVSTSRRLQDIVPGLGWELNGEPGGYCDGTYNSECGRHSNCMLSGHNDARSGIFFDSYSGWLVMTLPAMKEGIIVTKIESWHWPGEDTLTVGWTSIDNKGRRLLRGLGEGVNTTAAHEDASRVLKPQPPETCDKFTFEFAIDGKITVWTKADWEKNNKPVQRVVETQTLLDDPNFTTEPKDVELAIRMTGCGDSTKKTMSLTHVYFA
jgi:hypothetical protein